MTPQDRAGGIISMTKPLKFFKKTDLIIIVSMLAVCLVIWGAYQAFYTGKGAKAEIYYGGELVMTVDLNTGEERAFSVPQEPDVMFHLYSDGSIAFERSDCPDKICVHTGRISQIGQTAACLPNRLILKIVPADDKNTDHADIIV